MMLDVRAGEGDYDGVSYAELVFEEVDWSEAGDHDPGRRAERKGSSTERNVHAEWATEACQDIRRWVRSAGSHSGMTVKVTGHSEMAGFVITVILAAKDSPLRGRWWGATAWAAKPAERKAYEEG